MPTIWVPSLLRDLTDGRDTVTVPGTTVRQVIDALDESFPGTKERLCSQDALRSGIMVAVDTEVARLGLAEPVAEGSEVHFLPSISGGSAPPSPPPAPRPGWLSRNWKWFVPVGCLTPLLLCGGCCGVFFFGIFSIIKSSDVYKESVAKAQASPAVKQGLGSPVEPGFLPQGEVKTQNGGGSANLTIPISGPNGSGTIHVIADRVGGKWQYKKWEVTIEGRETPINLLAEE